MHPTNKKSLELCKKFSDDQARRFVFFVKCVLDLEELDSYKLNLIKTRVETDRGEFNQFEQSCEWEDEE